MVEHFGHGRLIDALHPTIEAVIGGLERHLHKSVRRESHRSHEVLAVVPEFESLELVLLNEVGKPRLCKAQGGAKFGNHIPLQLVRCRAYVSKAGRVALGGVRTARSPQTGGLAVDGAGESENGVCIHITGEAEDSVTVDTSMLEVDTCATVLADDDLELVVPSVGASPDLNATLDLAGSAQHVHAKIRTRCGLSIVQAENEQG